MRGWRARSKRIATLTAFGVFFALSSYAQTSGNDQNKGFDLKSSAGDLHLGNDGTPREAGLPVYPGARLRKDDNKDRNSANLSLFTSEFGVKLVIVNYDSDDAPAKVTAYYREKLKKYGKVLECHTKDHAGDINIDDDDKDSKSKELKCDGDNTGNVTELKVGTEDNQHVVAIEPADKGKGSTFALIYVHQRGKQADI